VIRRHKGFSLLEILIAFAIMAVAITIVLRVFGSGVNNAVTSEEYTSAVQIAESLMARTGIEAPLELGETQGNIANKFDWAVRITAVSDNNANSNGQAQNANPNQAQHMPAPTLVLVTVRVAWGDGNSSPRTIELTGLKML